MRVVLLWPERARLEGTLVSVAEDSLVVRTADNVARISTTSIERLEVYGSHTRIRSGALWGAASGCVAGLILGALATFSSDDWVDVSGWIVPVVGGMGLAGGALIGSLIGAIPTDGWIHVPLVRDDNMSRTQGASPQIGLAFRFSF